MALNLYFSPFIENLTKKLIEDYNQKKSNVFIDNRIILVPNKNFKKYLELEIADKNKISLNTNFQYLEEFLFNIFGELSEISDEEKSKIILLNNENYHLEYSLVILSEIISKRTNNRDLNNYLYKNDTLNSLKTWQISDVLAGLFREYEYHRSLMIKKWEKNDLFYNGSEKEVFQKEIFYNLFKKNGIIENINYQMQDEKKYQLISEFIDNVYKKKEYFKNLNKEIFIIGFSQISEFHIKLLNDLSNYININFYNLNFLEEVYSEEYKEIDKFYKNFIFENNILKQNENENKLVSLWGKTSRENLFTFFKTLYNANSIFKKKEIISDVINNKYTLLYFLQNKLMNNKLSVNINENIKQDKSIQIIGCPGINREVETVFNSIITNLREINDLDFSDIAIFVPDILNYEEEIKSCFSKSISWTKYTNENIEKRINKKDFDKMIENISSKLKDDFVNCFDIETDTILLKNNLESDKKTLIISLLNLHSIKSPIPFNISDKKVTNESIFGIGLINYLEMAKSNITRKEIISFLNNKIVMDCCKINENELDKFINLIGKLNIYRDFDRIDDRYFHSWEQGLKRLRMGRIMVENDHITNISNYNNIKKIIPFNDIETEDFLLINKFNEIICSIINNITNLKINNIKSGKEWIKELIDIIDMFFNISAPQFYNEINVIEHIKSDIEKLKLFDIACNEKNKLSIDYIIELIKMNLESIDTFTGKYLTEGVTISSFLPLRPIPFKIVYILGMNENSFPGYNEVSSLDLRNIDKQFIDIELPAANRYLFLETIMSVREKLYITYDSKDLIKDEEYFASSVVYQLINYIEKDIFKEKSTFKILQAPLKGYSTKYIYNENNDFTDLFYNYNVNDKITALSNLKKISFLKNIFIDNQKIDIYDIKEETDGIVTLNIRDLERFIINPIEMQLKYFLGIYDFNDEDETIVEDEPFFINYKIEKDIITKTINILIENYDDTITKDQNIKNLIANYFTNFYDYLNYKSETPGFVFSEIGKNELKIKIIERLKQNDYELINIIKARSENKFFTLSFGEENVDEKTGKYDKISLTLDNKKVIILGNSNYYIISDNILESLIITNSKSIKNISINIIKPFIMSYLLIGFIKDNIDQIIINISYKDKIVTYKYNVNKNLCKSYITGLISNLINDVSFDNLPFMTINEIIEKSKDKNIFENEIIKTSIINEKEFYKQIIDNEESYKIYTEYIKIVNLTDFKMFEENDFNKKVNIRLAPFYCYNKEDLSE